ncbi:MAG: YbhB/YbcL family Raf kinase inhibitor-like protein [Methanobacteriota archaeon]|nr:MAG: YbhB/YbcL family Raf kinase inhibitor-like protein [Euryarchaeota archaeon]
MVLVMAITTSGCLSQQKDKEVIYVQTITLTSTAFEEGGTIPLQHTCDGEDISPSLSWEGIPHGTRSLALIMDDPDAPAGTWVHWVIYNIPGDRAGLPEGVPAEESLADGTLQGTNDFRRIGYGGPCPPRGPPHRYYFKLYALDTALDLPAGASKAELERAMDGHIIGRGELMGRYGRQ